MKASDDLIQFIARKEGFRANAYQPVPGDKWTIGYGFTTVTGLPVAQGQTITEATADEILAAKVQGFANQISSQKIPQSVTQNQFDAVVSLVYNIGYGAFNSSTTGKLFYGGANISSKFPQWIFFNGKKLQGLLNRRTAEKAIYDTADYSK